MQTMQVMHVSESQESLEVNVGDINLVFIISQELLEMFQIRDVFKVMPLI